MGMIETRIKNAFDRFKQDSNLQELALAMARIGDYSIRSEQNATLMYDKIREQCPFPTFECVFYDGENGGVYHLLDFDPNGLSNEAVQIEIRSRLQHECHIDPHDVDKAMQSVYLIDTNTMRKVVTG